MEKNILLSVIAGVLATILMALTNLGTYVHESAHKLMAHLLYRITSERLQMFPFLDTLLQRHGKKYGLYEYTSDGLTTIGQYLGQNISSALVYISGPIIDTAISLILYTLGHFLREINPNLSIALRAAGLVYFLSILNHVRGTIISKIGDLYSFSEKININPLVIALIFAISLPILVVITYLQN